MSRRSGCTPLPSQNWKTNDKIVLSSVKLILKVSFDEVINVRKWHRTFFWHVSYSSSTLYVDIENEGWKDEVIDMTKKKMNRELPNVNFFSIYLQTKVIRYFPGCAAYRVHDTNRFIIIFFFQYYIHLLFLYHNWPIESQKCTDLICKFENNIDLRYSAFLQYPWGIKKTWEYRCSIYSFILLVRKKKFISITTTKCHYEYESCRLKTFKRNLSAKKYIVAENWKL